MSAMTRLDPTRVSPPAAAKLAGLHSDVVAEVAKAIEAYPVVVVGMAQNPHVKRARAALKTAGVDFQYLEYGSYFSDWGKRLAIKLWSGWPTFPQVFVKGVLVGGADLTAAALAEGTLQAQAKNAAQS